MTLKMAFLGAATAAATLTAATLSAQPAQALSLQFGSILNFTNTNNGGVQFSNDRLNFFNNINSNGTLVGRAVDVTQSTGSFQGAQQGANQTPPPPRIEDILLSGTGSVRNFVSTSGPGNLLLSGVNAPGLPGNPNVAFVVQQLTYTIAGDGSGVANFFGRFFETTGGTGQTPLTLGQILSDGTGSITIQSNANAPGFSSYSGSITAVPTPALLPGLVGFGIAALRKRKGEAATESETVKVKA